MTDAEKTYSRRLFLTYRQVIDGRTKDLDRAVADYARSNNGVDLEQQLSFAQWLAETEPGPAAKAE
jgi:hypothetical protein